MRIASFTNRTLPPPPPTPPKKKAHSSPLDGRLDGPNGQSKHFGHNKNLVCTGNQTPLTRLSNQWSGHYIDWVIPAHTYLLMELSASWEAANWVATQELPSVLWNPKVHYRLHKSPPLVPIACSIQNVLTSRLVSSGLDNINYSTSFFE
jgi:hypothetical protein